ncbi:FAD-binding oxidoreductase [Williamsia sp. 1135]|uniref:FAD-binding oxidoreductase n=1 Tax=Williamsia sp. 1135 TaxID=1889262 RepID=UPI000A0FEC35|nr:FAD-binding oxidoreductase [Williamsia sp. 1135]ORM38186.1 oxidoreductase [Williamsia sp. 1135]
MTSTTSSTFTLFDHSIDGSVVWPDDDGWDAARAAWQLTVDQQPLAVVIPASDNDVVRTVRAARSAGVQVAAQGTGHNAGPLGSLNNTVLLKLSEMNSVRIDVADRIARVGGGTLWGAVTDAAAEHGLAALAGSARDVGVVGYTLGGGLSWFARSHGLASNHVVAAEIVTADGALRRVDAVDDPDLFWAIRGGGGNFGVVTALEFRLFPIPTVQAGALFWPIERASDVLHAWREWTATVPGSVTSLGRVLQCPPIPEMPESVRGRALVTVEIVGQVDAKTMDALIAPLRSLSPETDTVAPTPAGELGHLHMDPPGPVPATGDGLLLTSLPSEALDAYLSVVDSHSRSPLLTTEIRHLGAAVRPGAPGGGAVSGIDARFAIYSGAITPTPQTRAAAREHLDRLATVVSPWAADTSYSNFAERPDTGDRLYGVDDHRLLRAIKENYDPTDVFRANHHVAPEALRADIEAGLT